MEIRGSIWTQGNATKSHQRHQLIDCIQLNANAVASAAGIAKSTAFNKIAAAKKRVIAAEDPKGEATKQPTPELPPSRKRKASADLEVGDIEGYVTKSSPKKKRGAKNSKPAQLTWATALSPETYEAEEGVSEGRAKQEVHKQGEAAQAGPEDIPVVSVEKDENQAPNNSGEEEAGKLDSH